MFNEIQVLWHFAQNVLKNLIVVFKGKVFFRTTLDEKSLKPLVFFT